MVVSDDGDEAADGDTGFENERGGEEAEQAGEGVSDDFTRGGVLADRDGDADDADHDKKRLEQSFGREKGFHEGDIRAGGAIDQLPWARA